MRAWKSGAWSLGGQIVNVLVTLVSLVILGRLLTPEQFGVFGLVLAVQALVLPFLDMGLQPVYLKLKCADAEVSNAFFTVNVLVGSLFSALIFAFAPQFAEFYDIKQLEVLLGVFAVSILFAAMSSQPTAVLSRRKRFDRIVQVNTIVLITGASLSILLAWSGFGVWSLIWRVLYETTARFILFSILSRQRYRIVGYRIIKPYFRELGFGIEIVFSRMVINWVNAIDKLLLGKFISLGEIGGYSRAQQIALMPNGSIRTAITTPALAYLARRRQGGKLDEYLLLYWIVFLLAGTPCLILAVFGDLIIPLLLGQQWLGMGWILQWLGLMGLGRVFQGLSEIYHIDRRVIKRTNQYTIVSLMGVYLFPVSLLIATKSLYYFVIGISVLSFTYWLGVLTYTMIKDSQNMKFKVVIWAFKLIAVGFISTIFLLYLKVNYVHLIAAGVVDVGSFLMFGILIQVMLIIILFVLSSNKEVKRLHLMVKA